MNGVEVVQMVWTDGWGGVHACPADGCRGWEGASAAQCDMNRFFARPPIMAAKSERRAHHAATLAPTAAS